MKIVKLAEGYVGKPTCRTCIFFGVDYMAQQNNPKRQLGGCLREDAEDNYCDINDTCNNWSFWRYWLNQEIETPITGQLELTEVQHE
ncbi:MAG: hypothetical protein FWG64_09085 [Firmicutes bacterium]|nr:hypothetical protein [Bacillota bacterium]